MITIFKNSIDDTGAFVVKQENEQYTLFGSTGSVGFRRNKRDGRNPVVGARGSRSSGITMTFITGNKPLENLDNSQII